MFSARERPMRHPATGSGRAGAGSLCGIRLRVPFADPAAGPVRRSACGQRYTPPMPPPMPPPIWSPGNRAFGFRLESVCALNPPGRRVDRGCEASGSKELRRRFSLLHALPRNAIRHSFWHRRSRCRFHGGYLARRIGAAGAARRFASGRRGVRLRVSFADPPAGPRWSFLLRDPVVVHPTEPSGR